jgi:prevent-host-death family protein
MATRNEEYPHGMSITDARNKLTKLPESLSGSPGVIPLTRRGRPVMALMSWELYESLTDTLEVMSDPGLMAQLRQSIQDIQEKRTVSLDELRDQLDRS